ncbi:MAG: TonB family protein [Magnetococcus sp. DMHC-1]
MQAANNISPLWAVTISLLAHLLLIVGLFNWPNTHRQPPRSLATVTFEMTPWSPPAPVIASTSPRETVLPPPPAVEVPPPPPSPSEPMHPKPEPSLPVTRNPAPPPPQRQPKPVKAKKTVPPAKPQTRSPQENVKPAPTADPLPATSPATSTDTINPRQVPESWPPATRVYPAATTELPNKPLPESPPDHTAAYLHNPRPAYPPFARRMGQEGTVVLRVDVSATGGVLNVSVQQSSGFPLLDQAAVEAVQHYRFVPAQRDGGAVQERVMIPLRFRLQEADAP